MEAPVERIDAVLAAQSGVRDLVENGWVRLFALDPAGPTVQRRTPEGWQPAHEPGDDHGSIADHE